MFSEKDFEDAIEQGIFNRDNETIANPDQVIKYFKKWAELKCKETARNVRHKACEIYYDVEDARDIDVRIMNIKFHEVKPS